MILWFSDVHVHRWTKFAEPDEQYVNTRVRRTMEALHGVRVLTSILKPKLVVFGGDFVHNPKAIDFTLYSMAFEIMREISKMAPIVALRGNHDEVGEFAWGSAVHPLSGIPGIEVITEPKTISHDAHWPRTITFFPYSKKFPRSSGGDITFCHHDIVENVIMGHALGSDSWQDLACGVIISGHYHKPKVFRSGDYRRFIYGGALLPHSFVDEGDHSFGALVITSNKDALTTALSGCNDFVVEDVEGGSVFKIIRKGTWKFIDLTFHSAEDVQKIRDKTYNRFYIPHGKMDVVLPAVRSLQGKREIDFRYEIFPLSVEQTKQMVVDRSQLLSNNDLIKAYSERKCPKDLDARVLTEIGVALDTDTFSLDQFLPKFWKETTHVQQ